MIPSWHCSVGFTLTGKDGAYCGFVGCAIPCSSQEEGWAVGLAWLRTRILNPWQNYLVCTFKLEVRFF